MFHSDPISITYHYKLHAITPSLSAFYTNLEEIAPVEFWKGPKICGILNEYLRFNISGRLTSFLFVTKPTVYGMLEGTHFRFQLALNIGFWMVANQLSCGCMDDETWYTYKRAFFVTGWARDVSDTYNRIVQI